MGMFMKQPMWVLQQQQKGVKNTHATTSPIA